MEEEGEMPPALERKLAARQAFAASIDAALEGEGRGGAEQDWIEHATPGNDIPLAALLGSRNGWKLIKARPTVADLVLVRERGVLYAGTHGQGVWRLKVQ